MTANAIIANPFPGLRPFREDESYLFFGREKQIDELLNTLQSTRLLAIVGASGSGKSSLVKCGLIPSLHSGFIAEAGSEWEVALFTPGNAPYQNMATALSNILYDTKNEEESVYHNSITEATLRRSSKGLIELYKENQQLKNTNFLLVIDQFEEIFRFRKQEIENESAQQDTVSFINLLLETAKLQEAPIYVVFTMRSDYLGDCTLFRGLPEAINDGQYLIPRMTREERKEAILGPIGVGGGASTNQLITRLLNDVGNNPDQLPILQHALMRTWTYWKEHEQSEVALDIKHYEAIGGMSKALSRHAEEAYSELKTDKQRRICELMFKALTEKGTDNKGVRRPLKVAEIAELTDSTEEETKEVINVFRKTSRSFLMPSANETLTSATIIDIAHESLMRVWGRLINWVNEEQQSSETYLRLAEAAALYQQSQSGLWRDPELQIALRWQELNQPNEAWAKRYNPSFERAISFLEYSQNQNTFEVEEKERRQLLRLRRTRIIAIVVSIAAILALILATYAIFQRTEAVKQKQQADEHRLLAEEKEKEAITQKDIADQERERALEEEKEAIRQRKLADEQRKEAVLQKEEAIRQEKEATKQKQIAEEQKNIAEKLRVKAEENEEIANTQKNEALKQRTEAQKQREEALRQERAALKNEKEANRLKNLALSRSSSLEAIQIIKDGAIQKGAKQALEAYQLNKDFEGPRQNDANYQALHEALITLKSDAYVYQDEGSVKAVTALPNSNTIAIANEEGHITILEKEKNALKIVRQIDLKGQQFLGISYSKNKQYLAATSYEGNLAIWDTKQFTEKSKPLVKDYFVPVLNVIPLQNASFVTHTKNKVFVENIKNGELKRKASKAYPKISTVKASEDGQLVIVASGNQLHIHPIEGDLSLGTAKTITLSKAITAVTISKDKKHLAVGFEDGQVAILELDADLNSSTPEYELMHQTKVSGLAFYQHKDFLQLASASYDNTIRLFDVTNKNNTEIVQDKISLKGHRKWSYDIIYSPDGKFIYTVNEDKTLRVWNTLSEEMVDNLKTLVK